MGGRQWGHGTRQASDLSRCGTRGREDVRDAVRGAPQGRAGDRLCRGLRGASRAAAHGGDAARARGGPAPGDRVPGRRLHRDGRRRRAAAGPRRRPGGRTRPHQHPGLSQRQALAGRGGAVGGGGRRGLDREHPASGVARRRSRVDHRRAPAGDRARRVRPAGRPDRACRHVAPGAAAADGARQRLPAGQGRRGSLQLLPARQPHRPARARPAVGGRPRRRVPQAVPQRAPRLQDLGFAGADRGRADRRAGGADPHPAGRAAGREGCRR